ncbi:MULTISPECIES: hypothetical protein [Thermocrispum]|jgi:hypothetical protein|nr:MULTISPECIES: hypothetical protein [Thermocrispum]
MCNDKSKAMKDAVDRDTELFTAVAQTHPGIVRTLHILINELDAACGLLDPEVQRQPGERVRRIGDTVISRVDDSPAGCQSLAPKLRATDMT